MNGKTVRRKLKSRQAGSRNGQKTDAGPESGHPGRIPRITKLMALAIRFDQLLRDGVVKDQAELAKLGHVTRARVTQIMNLLNLAPDIQEQILFLPLVQDGRDPVTEREIRPVVTERDWLSQRFLCETIEMDLH